MVKVKKIDTEIIIRFDNGDNLQLPLDKAAEICRALQEYFGYTLIT